MRERYEYRSYKPGDEEQILALFEQSFGRPMSLAYWRWRWGMRQKSRDLLLLAWQGGLLVGHYALSPLTVSVDGHEHAAVHTHSAMTHPEHRGRGLFGQMIVQMNELMGRKGVALELGWPNHNSHRGFVRDLGWRDIHELPIFRKPLDDGIAVPPPSLPVEPLDGFDERFDRLWEVAKGRYAILFKRDGEYLSWRYGPDAPQGYRVFVVSSGSDLAGYAICKRYENVLDVVDVTCTNLPAGEALLARMVEVAVAEGFEAVTAWLNPSLDLHWTLEKWGFRNSGPVTYFAGRLLEAGAGLDQVYDYRRWHMTMGDSDVF